MIMSRREVVVKGVVVLMLLLLLVGRNFEAGEALPHWSHCPPHLTHPLRVGTTCQQKQNLQICC